MSQNTVVVALPAPGTTVVQKLEPGSYTQFLFKLDQIDNLRVMADGALEMKMKNGSVLVVENFQELAHSAESCGQDTIFQMLDETAMAGTDGLKIINVNPDTLLQALHPSATEGDVVVLNAPAANMTKEVLIEPGQTYEIGFDWGAAAKTVDGTNLMLSFSNGGLLILRDFVEVAQGSMPPAMTLADGSVVDINQLVVAACSADPETLRAQMSAPQTGVRADGIAAIEPAAGEDHHSLAKAAQKVAAVEPAAGDALAQQVANIEPAAGGAGAPVAGGRGGAGFASGIDPAALAGLDPLGPIGPTALQYSIPSVNAYPVAGVLAAAPVPVPPGPPPAPTLIVQDEFVEEDHSVALHVVATAPDGAPVVLVISNIPANWSVDPGLGSYDPVAHTWTITVPEGGTFTGGPVLAPPANADGDISTLQVTATATSTTTGLSSVSTGAILVVTDAVADVPTLSVAPVVGLEDVPANLVISTAPTDLDGSEVISAIYVSGLPAGFTLSAGVVQPDGSVLLTPAQLAGLQIIAPAHVSGSFDLTVKSVVTETHLSGLEPNLANNTNFVTATVPVLFVPDADRPVLSVQNVCVVEDGSVLLPISAQLVDRDGSEFLTVRVENIPSGWTVNANGGAYDALAGVWTITLPAGADFTGGPILTPPANSDVDALSLRVFATATEAGNGDQETVLSTVNVVVDAAADQPTLSTSAVSGEQGTPIVLPITASLVDGDGSEVLSVRVSGLPFGASLSAGALQSDGSYLLTSVQLSGLKLIPAAATVGTFTLTVDSIATETNLSGDECTLDNNVAVRSQTVLVTVGADDVPALVNALSVVDETAMNPLVSVSGTVSPTYGADTGVVTPTGLTSFVAGGSLLAGALTHNGAPVVVTLSGDTYTGRAGATDVFTLQVNSDGTYTFNLLQNLDHADGANLNDAISLTFGVTATDQEGDSTPGTIRIDVQDDGPVAVVDTASSAGGSTASGNVLSNDDAGEDNPALVVSVAFNGGVVAVPVTGTALIAGAHGTLEIAASGVFTYTASNGANGADVFTYTIRDFDGDPSSTTLSVAVSDGKPGIGDAAITVDETALGPITTSGTLTYAYGADGAGTITPSGASSFTAGGSLLGGSLTHHGVPVVVTLSGETYTGKAGATDVFTLQVHSDGTYTFNLLQSLDHADPANPNDTITLGFGVTITDKDGDVDTGTITVNVNDDGPSACPDTIYSLTCACDVSGNILGNDQVGADETGLVTQVTFGGHVYALPADGSFTQIQGTYGLLKVSNTGSYVYTPGSTVGTDQFQYTMRDYDGDTASSTITVCNTGYATSPGLTVTANSGVDLGSLISSGSASVTFGNGVQVSSSSTTDFATLLNASTDSVSQTINNFVTQTSSSTTSSSSSSSSGTLTLASTSHATLSNPANDLLDQAQHQAAVQG